MKKMMTSLKTTLNNFRIFIKENIFPTAMGNEYRAIIRVMQNALQEEEEKRKHLEQILAKISEDKNVELPLPIVFEIWDYIHAEELKDNS